VYGQRPQPPRRGLADQHRFATHASAARRDIAVARVGVLQSGNRRGLQHLRVGLPGHGDIDWTGDGDYSRARVAADIASLIGQLDRRSLVLVGHSFGGPVGALVAAQMPDRIRALVTIDSTLMLMPGRTNISLRCSAAANIGASSSGTENRSMRRGWPFHEAVASRVRHARARCFLPTTVPTFPCSVKVNATAPPLDQSGRSACCSNDASHRSYASAVSPSSRTWRRYRSGAVKVHSVRAASAALTPRRRARFVDQRPSAQPAAPVALLLEVPYHSLRFEIGSGGAAQQFEQQTRRVVDLPCATSDHLSCRAALGSVICSRHHGCSTTGASTPPDIAASTTAASSFRLLVNTL
jgi:pimeloyl-ACP methyl ester carboxylesterase